MSKVAREKAAVPTETQTEVQLPALERRGVIITLRGVTPLVVHKFSEFAKQAISDKQGGTATKAKKDARTPEKIAQEIAGAHYHVEGNESLPITEGRYGFPSIAFKKAAVSAAAHGTGLFKSRARGQFFVSGDVVPITCSRVEAREDAVRLETGTVYLTYRPEYQDWRCEVGVEYYPHIMTLEQLLNLFDIAGTLIGVGENRPEKSGDTWGRWEIAEARQVPVSELPRYRRLPDVTTTLSRASDIARKMGAIS